MGSIYQNDGMGRPPQQQPPQPYRQNQAQMPPPPPGPPPQFAGGFGVSHPTPQQHVHGPFVGGYNPNGIRPNNSNNNMYPSSTNIIQQQPPFRPPQPPPHHTYPAPPPLPPPLPPPQPHPHPPPPPPSQHQPPPPPPLSMPPPPPSSATPYYHSTPNYQQQHYPQPRSPPPPPPPPSSPPRPSHPPPPPPQPKAHSSVPNSHWGSSSATPSKAQNAPHGSNHRGHSSSALQPKLPMTPAKLKAPSPMPARPISHRGSGPSRGETEEERKLRKKRELEPKKQEEKRRDKQRPHVSSATKALLDKRSLETPAHGDGKVDKNSQNAAEKVDNKLRKPTTFVCKLVFRNELPDPTAQPKLLSINTNKDRYTKYAVTSLEKSYKPKLYVEPDLGIPLDLLDLSVYKSPDVMQLDPEDEELLRDDEAGTPNKLEGIRRKERPTDTGFSWLVKTQYISSVSLENTRQVHTDKQARERRESREFHHDVLDSLNNREKQIMSIEESFRAAKSRPVHQTNSNLEPVEIIPLLPDFDRWDDELVLALFDGEATEEEKYNKLDHTIRDELESRAIMKSFVLPGEDPSASDKFLSYMVPGLEELMNDEDEEDISYTWLREYRWKLLPEKTKDPSTYVITFGQDAARYLPLPAKLTLHRRARHNEDLDNQFPVPSKVVVRNRGLTHKEEEVRDAGRARLMEGHANVVRSISGAKRMASDDSIHRSHQKLQRLEETEQNLSAEEDMSD